jgi:hypothetical protein
MFLSLSHWLPCEHKVLLTHVAGSEYYTLPDKRRFWTLPCVSEVASRVACRASPYGDQMLPCVLLRRGVYFTTLSV